MSDDPRALLKRFYDAESAYLDGGEDFAAMTQTLHENCVMLQPDALPYAGTWIGHDGYHRWLDAFSQAWKTLRVTDAHVHLADAHTVFSRSTVVATARATAADITYPLLQMILIRDERIARIEPFYWDTHAVRDILTTGDR